MLKVKATIQEPMPVPRLNQLLSESATWKRLLSFLMDENIYLKNRISEILKTDFDTSLLAKLESFQTSFIHTDTLVALLRNDVVEFDKILARGTFDQLNEGIAGRLQKIRRNIISTERTFNQLQTAFNNYLSESI